MKHDDTTLQAAIDAAMLEIGEQVYAKNFAACPKYYRSAWPEEADDRLALAKSFLAKLPEPQPSKGETCSVCNWTNTSLINLGNPDVPRWACIGCCKRVFDQKLHPITADDGRSLGQVAKEAFIGAPGLTDDWMNAAAQAVAAVVLAQAIARMEAVPVDEVAEIIRRQWLDRGGWIEPAAQAVRARLIAAARGEARLLMTKNIPGDKCPLCGAEEVASNTPNTVYACGSSDYDGRPETFHPGDKCEALTVGINGLTEAEEAKTASVAGLSKPNSERPAQTANEQPKQQGPLGPEEKLQAIKDILEIK